MPTVMPSNTVNNEIAANMRKEGRDTKGILKSLMAPKIKELNLPKDAPKAGDLLVATDMIFAQARAKISTNIELSDSIMDKIANLGQSIQDVMDKKPKAISAQMVENYNARVLESNNNSAELTGLRDSVKQSKQDTEVTQSDLFALSKSGKITGAELDQKLRENEEKVKQMHLTGPQSNVKQSDNLHKNQLETDKQMDRMGADMVQIKARHGLTEGMSAAPAAKSERHSSGHGGGMGRGGK